ncbi:MAG: uroporphyrinogen-III synthase [Gammaproteobacteria bacterium]|nr:uroporphyrinogen-III synthase [Gammaproteobacteria bacterium]
MRALAGAGIVVTRPAGRGQSLCKAIAAEGGTALSLPVLAIESTSMPLDDFPLDADWYVFTSTAAVEHAPSLNLPARARFAAIGRTTADALGEALGRDCLIIVPEIGEETSEGLLASPDFDPAAEQKVCIVKGEGGRTALADAVFERGAKAVSAAVYRRRPATPDARPMLAALAAGRLHAVVVTSGESLDALLALLGKEADRLLAEVQLVAPSARVIKLAEQAGAAKAPILADGTADRAIMTALTRWWSGQKKQQ